MSIVFGKRYTSDTIDTIVREAQGLKESLSLSTGGGGSLSPKLMLQDDVENERIVIVGQGPPEFLARFKQTMKERGWKPVLTVNPMVTERPVPKKNNPDENYSMEQNVVREHAPISRIGFSETNVVNAPTLSNIHREELEELVRHGDPSNIERVKAESKLRRMANAKQKAATAFAGASGSEENVAQEMAFSTRLDAVYARAFAVFLSKMNELTDIHSDISEVSEASKVALQAALAVIDDDLPKDMVATNIVDKYLEEQVKFFVYDSNKELKTRFDEIKEEEGEAAANEQVTELIENRRGEIIRLSARIFYNITLANKEFLDAESIAFDDLGNFALRRAEDYYERYKRMRPKHKQALVGGGQTRKRRNLHKKRRTRNRNHKNRRTH